MKAPQSPFYIEGTEAPLALVSPVCKQQSWEPNLSPHSGAWLFLFLPLGGEEWRDTGEDNGKDLANRVGGVPWE